MTVGGLASFDAPSALDMARGPGHDSSAAVVVDRDNTSMQTQPGDVDAFKQEERMSTLDEVNLDEIDLGGLKGSKPNKTQQHVRLLAYLTPSREREKRNVTVVLPF